MNFFHRRSHPFRYKKKKQQQQEVTPDLFEVAQVRRSIADAEATVHGQIKGKATVTVVVYVSDDRSSINLILVKITHRWSM